MSWLLSDHHVVNFFHLTGASVSAKDSKDTVQNIIYNPCACVCAQSCPTLCNPMDSSISVHGIFQARILEWTSISSYKGCLSPRGGTKGL